MRQTEITPTDEKISKLIGKFFERLNSGKSSVRSDVARDNSAYEKRQQEEKERETGEQVFGADVDVEITHNQNRAPVSEIREDYVWIISIAMIILFFIGAYIVTHQQGLFSIFQPLN